MKPIRVIIVVVLLAAVLLGVSSAAVAQEGTCSGTTFNPGDIITVTGSGATPGEQATLRINGAAIGAATVDGFGNFAVSGQIPPSTPPGTYTISVTFTTSATIVPCTITVVPAQATAPPTASPTAAPTAPPAVATPPVVFVPVGGPIFQQQQQQQQGGGGGAAAPADPRRPGQQQQFVPAPRFVPTGGVALPKTGAEVTRMAVWGSVLLAIGLTLVLIARRRRRAARRRALAELPPIEAVVVEPEQPWLPGTAHPSEFLTEADGLPPVYEPHAARLSLPAPADEDILTPSF